jgi:hypothetical protein
VGHAPLHAAQRQVAGAASLAGHYRNVSVIRMVAPTRVPQIVRDAALAARSNAVNDSQSRNEVSEARQATKARAHEVVRAAILLPFGGVIRGRSALFRALRSLTRFRRNHPNTNEIVGGPNGT